MIFEKILAKEKGKNTKKTIIFVGDGINDAPVLKRADIGIAMGKMGADVSIESSDIVIMNDDCDKINEAIEISRRTDKIVWQNIIFALSIKIGVMLFTTTGLCTMWEAIFADVGVALLAILNARRILK